MSRTGGFAGWNFERFARLSGAPPSREAAARNWQSIHSGRRARAENLPEIARAASRRAAIASSVIAGVMRRSGAARLIAARGTPCSSRIGTPMHMDPSSFSPISIA